ncbi:hypothetical protein HU200_041814 [Digitaria exilis]|uniref:Uncharacterized protein n=1 Tax=Digitaria exilis TaxID=1010633 RepID=A0A835EGD3_9POAL|nr:hypothetical protein HU200_041814 [Digitaria exilis]
MQYMLLQAACDGDLRLFKRLVRALDKGRGRLKEAVEAARTDGGNGALHLAAGAVRMEVCSYLVEGLRVDVNAVDDKGDCEMVQLLLAKGAFVDPLAVECGTPLHVAAKERQAGAMKILLDHNADAINVSSVECVKLLVQAGADVSSDCVSTALIDSNLGNECSTECLNFLLDSGASHNVPDDAMDLDPEDATLLSNRSLCWLRMGDAEKALQDAVECKEMRPDWPKACYRQGAALLLMKDYKRACEALFDGFKLDPENAEIENALRQAMELVKISDSTRAG